MDFKDSLLSYFEKTEIPDVLEPDKVFSFVKPKAVEKKAVETAAVQADSDNAAQSESKKENAQPKFKEAQEDSPQSETGASAFIKVVFFNKLTRNEFLSLLGNTKINSQTLQKIKDNPGLTVKGLIDILEESPLTAEDYKKLVISAERTAQLKAEAREKLKSEGAKHNAENSPSNPIVSPVSSKSKIDLNNLISPKTQEMPPIKEHEPDRSRTNEFSINGAKEKVNTTDKGTDSPAEEPEQKKEKSKKRLLFGRRNDDEFEDDELEDFDEEEDEDEEYEARKRRRKKKNTDDDDYDEDEDYDEDYDDEHGSNTGKFVAAVIGAIILIAVSFGLRYYFTGSIFPNTENTPQKEIIINEDYIFDLIGTKPSAQLSAYEDSPLYTVGGISEERCLKQAVTTEKRLAYISGNSLYIFEQIGGQTAQLDVRNYPSDIRLMGLVETEKGIAVVSCNEGEPYSFYKTEEVPGETGEPSSPPKPVSDTVTRPETVVELLDRENPEKRTGIVKYRLSGTLSKVFTESGKLILLTEENIPANCSKEDYATFMPFVLTSEGRKLCSADKTVVAKDVENSVIGAIFALDFEKETAMFCAAGSLVRAAALNNGYLYFGAGDRLIRLSVSGDLTEKGSYSVNGSFEAFSAIGFSLDGASGERRIRAAYKGKQGTDLSVLDGDFKLVSEIKNLGNGEAAVAACFYKDQTYIVTESGTCFGVDGNNAVITESAVKIVSSSIYPLSVSGKSAMGIKVTPVDENGKRTSLTVSSIKLDGTEAELGKTQISSKTVAKNALDEYLSSPAENDVFSIGSKTSADTAGGIVVIPVVYFDGVSEVELFVIYSVSAEGILSINGTMAHYDSYSKNVFALVKGDYVIAVTDNRIITAKAENGSVTSYYDITADDSEYKY